MKRRVRVAVSLVAAAVVILLGRPGLTAEPPGKSPASPLGLSLIHISEPTRPY